MSRGLGDVYKRQAEVIAQKIRDTKTKDKLAIMKDKQYNDYEFSNLKSA